MDPILFPNKKAPPKTQDGELSLFGDPTPKKETHAPYQTASETSRAAAEQIRSKSESMERLVFDHVVQAAEFGVTRKELESRTDLLTQTLCARLNALEERKLIRKRYHLNGDNPAELVKRDNCSVYVATGKEYGGTRL
jgi:hypothetical protein